MRRLLLATSNSHKVSEVRAILGPGWQVLTLEDFPKVEMPEETGSTFEKNAALKALAISQQVSQLPVLADDSGLEVDALGGAPGVRSARFAGEHATDAENRAKLLSLLQGVPSNARFRCSLALAGGGQLQGTWSGEVVGSIVPEERGTGGFGYDPLFIPHGETLSFAELPAAAKNAMSHRARALHLMQADLAATS